MPPIAEIWTQQAARSPWVLPPMLPFVQKGFVPTEPRLTLVSDPSLTIQLSASHFSLLPTQAALGISSLEPKDSTAHEPMSYPCILRSGCPPHWANVIGPIHCVHTCYQTSSWNGRRELANTAQRAAKMGESGAAALPPEQDLSDLISGLSSGANMLTPRLKGRKKIWCSPQLHYFITQAKALCPTIEPSFWARELLLETSVQSWWQNFRW